MLDYPIFTTWTIAFFLVCLFIWFSFFSDEVPRRIAPWRKIGMLGCTAIAVTAMGAALLDVSGCVGMMFCALGVGTLLGLPRAVISPMELYFPIEHQLESDQE